MRLYQDAQSIAAAAALGFTQGGRLVGANFNTTADQPIEITSPTRYYTVFRQFVINPSTSLTTAQGSLYLGAGKSVILSGTTTPYTTAQVSTIDTLNNCQSVTISNAVVTDNTTIYLSLTTAQGAPATADVYVYIIPLWGA